MSILIVHLNMYLPRYRTKSSWEMRITKEELKAETEEIIITEINALPWCVHNDLPMHFNLAKSEVKWANGSGDGTSWRTGRR